RPDADPAQVAAALEGLAAGAALVQRPLERARQLAELSEGVRFMLLLAAAMALVAAAFLIGTNALAAVNERRGDLATLRAMGLGRRTLTAWILTELAVLGVAGSTAGAVLGPVVANALTNVAASQALGGRLQGLGPLELEWSVLAVGLASGVLSAVLAAWPAARWAAGGRGSQVGPNPRPPGATGALGGTLVLLLILLATRMAVLPARSSSVAGVTVGLLALVLAAAW